LLYSVVARNSDILKKLVMEAKREYEKDAEYRVHIFMADTYGSTLNDLYATLIFSGRMVVGVGVAPARSVP
jgi:hypothetical protein